MQHELCKQFLQYWKDSQPDDGLPELTAFSAGMLDVFDESGVTFRLDKGDIVFDYLGAGNMEVLAQDVIGRPYTDLFPYALQPLQMALVMPCFQQKVGMVRLSRVWFGHRHKDVEWILLPVIDPATSEVVLVGISNTFVEFDPRDSVEVGSTVVERIIQQNFLSLGQTVDLSVIDSHGWAVLDTMGARVAVDNECAGHAGRGIVGEAGLVATKIAHASVLAVASPSDFGQFLARFGARYNLKMVTTPEEAQEILAKDMIDVLVVTESIGSGRGLALMETAQKLNPFTACVMLLDQREKAEDTKVVVDGKFVQCLVKPVGEFALRQALDDANKHVSDHRHAELKKT